MTVMRRKDVERGRSIKSEMEGRKKERKCDREREM